MKKFLVVLVALLFATGAFAQDAAKKGAEFKYSVAAWAYGYSGSQGDKEWDYQHIRVRPMFSAENENVKAVVRLELDQNYGYVHDGSADVYPEGNDPAVGADPGTDNKSLEVKWAYVQVKDFFVPNLTFTTGLKDYFYPMVVDNDFGMTSAAYDFGMGTATAAYLKIIENDYVEVDEFDVDSGDDIQVYVADVLIKAGNINVRPAFFYLTSSLDSTVFSNYALNVNGDFGMVSFDATGGYMTGSDSADLDSTDYGYDVIVNIKPVEGVTIGIFTTSTTGDDGTGDSVGYYATLDQNGGAPDGRLFALENNGLDSNGTTNMFDITGEAYGYTVYGVTAEGVFGKLSVLAQYGYFTASEDNTSGETAIGSEIDGQVAYEVAPGTSFMLQASYIMADDESFHADDVQQFAWGLTTKI